MSRIAFQLALFFLPFLAYGLWLHFTNRGWRAPERWGGVPLIWLAGAGVALVLSSLAVLALTGGGSTRAIYEPAHMKDGVFVPGRLVEPDQK